MLITQGLSRLGPRRFMVSPPGRSAARTHSLDPNTLRELISANESTQRVFTPPSEADGRTFMPLQVRDEGFDRRAPNRYNRATAYGRGKRLGLQNRVPLHRRSGSTSATVPCFSHPRLHSYPARVLIKVRLPDGGGFGETRRPARREHSC